jgi:hypothetical protein
LHDGIDGAAHRLVAHQGEGALKLAYPAPKHLRHRILHQVVEIAAQRHHNKATGADNLFLQIQPPPAHTAEAWRNQVQQPRQHVTSLVLTANLRYFIIILILLALFFNLFYINLHCN